MGAPCHRDDGHHAHAHDDDDHDDDCCAHGDGHGDEDDRERASCADEHCAAPGGQGSARHEQTGLPTGPDVAVDIGAEPHAHKLVTSQLRVRNLCCEAEMRLIHRMLDPMVGVATIDANLVAKSVYVQHCADDGCAPPRRIVEVLNGVSMGATLLGAAVADDAADSAPAKTLGAWLRLHWETMHLTLLWMLCLGAAVPYFILPREEALERDPVLIALSVCTLLGIAPMIVSMVREWIVMRSFRLEMRFLMTVAVAGAIALAELFESALLVTLYATSKLLERAILKRVERSVSVASHLSMPRTATTPKHGVVQLSDLKVGDDIELRAGEQCMVDGVVADGSVVVSVAALTGEHEPVTKHAGDAIISGSMVLHGFARLTLTAPADQSELAQVMELVAQAQAQRSATARAVDKFAMYWTPIVIVAAACVAGIGSALHPEETAVWVERALILLLLSCPCALVFAAPIPTMSAVASSARRGVLFKTADAVEQLASVQTIGLDKTGTLTTGDFAVVALENVAGAQDESVRMAAALEARSSHPMAYAVVAAAFGRHLGSEGFKLPEVKIFEDVPGAGVRGTVKDSRGRAHNVTVGNARVLDGVTRASEARATFRRFTDARAGDSVLAVVVDKRLSLMLALNDQVRPEAQQAVRQLHALGVRPAMLTGAAPEAAASVAEQVGITVADAHAALLPSDKTAWVRAHQPIAMLGDGINDAEALAAAKVGIAIGAAGTALASKAADVILLNDNVLRVPQSISLCRTTVRTIFAGIVLSVLIKLAAMAIAFLGYLPLWGAVLVDVGSLLAVAAVGTTILKTSVWE